MQFRALLLAAVLGGCGSQDIGAFSGGQPSMSPVDWMAGTVDGYGVVTDRFGTVKSQFHAHEVGSWDAAAHTVTLVEHIAYLQGSADPPTDRTRHHFCSSLPSPASFAGADSQSPSTSSSLKIQTSSCVVPTTFVVSRKELSRPACFFRFFFFFVAVPLATKTTSRVREHTTGKLRGAVKRLACVGAPAARLRCCWCWCCSCCCCCPTQSLPTALPARERRSVPLCRQAKQTTERRKF